MCVFLDASQFRRPILTDHGEVPFLCAVCATATTMRGRSGDGPRTVDQKNVGARQNGMHTRRHRRVFHHSRNDMRNSSSHASTSYVAAPPSYVVPQPTFVEALPRVSMSAHEYNALLARSQSDCMHYPYICCQHRAQPYWCQGCMSRYMFPDIHPSACPTQCLTPEATSCVMPVSYCQSAAYVRPCHLTSAHVSSACGDYGSNSRCALPRPDMSVQLCAVSPAQPETCALP